MKEDLDHQPLTLGRAARIITAAAMLVGWCGLCLGAYYQLRADLQLTQLRLDRLEERQDDSDRLAKELTRAVDNATLIMGRIDKKLGQP